MLTFVLIRFRGLHTLPFLSPFISTALFIHLCSMWSPFSATLFFGLRCHFYHSSSVLCCTSLLYCSTFLLSNHSMLLNVRARSAVELRDWRAMATCGGKRNYQFLIYSITHHFPVTVNKLKLPHEMGSRFFSVLRSFSKRKHEGNHSIAFACVTFSDSPRPLLCVAPTVFPGSRNKCFQYSFLVIFFSRPDSLCLLLSF